MKRKYKFHYVTYGGVKRTTKYWNQKYREYTKKLDKAVEKALSKGQEFNDMTRMTKAEFLEEFVDIAKFERESGQKKSAIDTIINEQRFEFSEGRYRAIRKLAQEQGIDLKDPENRKLFSRSHIRNLSKEELSELPLDWEEVENYTYELAKKYKNEYGKTDWKTVNKIIGQTYFGSK